MPTAVEDLGQLGNTLIIYISGDNGASAEDMLNGTPNEFTTFNGVEVPVKDQFLWYPFWGSESTYPHFAAPWAWAFDTPFKWVKQVASHFGGTAQGMAISWPGHFNDVGGVRRQFHHIIDIAPTIPRSGRYSAARHDRRHQAASDGRREHGVHLGQGERRDAFAPDDAVFRDARQSRRLSRGMGGGDDAGDPSLGTEHQAGSGRDHRLHSGVPASGAPSTAGRKTFTYSGELRRG
jgi:Sulfatase